MRKFDDKEILDSVERLPTFKGWKKGEYDIWVRSSADAFDQFDDKAFTYHCSADGERPIFFMSRSGTTNAGSYGLKHFDEYNHEGCAVLKADVIVYGSHIYGLHHGKPAYRQSKSWPYYRDNNRNNRAEEIGTVHSGVIGANIHRAGVNSTVIKNWSTACLVTANLAKFLAFLAYMKSQGNPPLNVTVLKESTISAAASTGRGLAGPDADESSSVEIPAGSPSGSDEQPPIQQNADQIINTGDNAPPAPDPQDITMNAPAPMASVATSNQVMIGSIVVPGFIVAIFKGIGNIIDKGYIDAKDVGNTLINLVSNNFKYIAMLAGLVIVVIIVKKIERLILFGLSMVTHAIPGWNSISVAPPVAGVKKTWWRFW